MNNIKKIRKEANMTQQKLASLLGASRSSISMWESGVNQPDNDTLLKIANIFNVSVDYLLGRDTSGNQSLTDESPLTNKEFALIEVKNMFSDILKKLRKENHITQEALALKIGVERSSIGKYEASGVIPSIDVLLKIADLFNVTLDYLLGRDMLNNNTNCTESREDKNMFSLRLKELRIKNGMYQKDVAKILGIERTTYVKYETGVTEPDIKTLIKLADIFNVTLDYLLGRSTSSTASGSPSPEGKATIQQNESPLTNKELALIEVKNMFSLRLKGLRVDKKLTQIQLAQELNVSIGAVGNWEAGKRMPDYSALLKIADYFLVSVDYLLGRETSGSQSRTGENPLSEKELALVTAYRSNPAMQGAVDKLLGVPAEPTNSVADDVVSELRTPLFVQK